MIGRTVSHYKIIDKLGEGGMGTVYHGVDLMLERPVAIKALHPHISRQPGVVERFRSEAALLAKLNDPNIATLYSFFREGDEFFMVMELVNGHTLASLMRCRALDRPEQAVAIISQVLSALDHAHRLGILHRDIKPANILVTDQNTVKITDFGIARALGSERLTRDMRVVGTLEYVAPERIRGEEGDLRSDIYSVGAVLYELLAGRLPFERNSDFDLMRAHLEEAPLPLREAGPHIPPSLESVVLRALAKRSEDRFSTAKEMRDALTAVEVRPPLAATRFAEPIAIPETKFVDPLPAQTQSRSPHKRPTNLWVWLGIGCAAALALVLFVVILARRPESHPAEATPDKAETPTVESKPAPQPPAAAPPPAAATPAPVPENPAAATNTAAGEESAAQERRAARAKRRAAALQALDQ
jgi:serine/threonine-protein kinase